MGMILMLRHIIVILECGGQPNMYYGVMNTQIRQDYSIHVKL